MAKAHWGKHCREKNIYWDTTHTFLIVGTIGVGKNMYTAHTLLMGRTIGVGTHSPDTFYTLQDLFQTIGVGTPHNIKRNKFG